MTAYLDVHGIERAVAPACLEAILSALQAQEDVSREHVDAALPSASSAILESATTSFEAAKPSPVLCHLPSALLRGDRIWGVAVQLYSVRSERNWGIGDFSDLSTFASQWAANGADLIGVNPLHALLHRNLSVASPYSPSSRLHLNWLYLDVERVVGFDESPAVQHLVASDDFKRRLGALRTAETVDYLGVASLKAEVLRLLHADFTHLAPDAREVLEFESFRQSRGASLRRHAAFEVLQATFEAAHANAVGWRDWPEAFRSPDAEAVQRFVSDHRTEVEYIEFLEWQASRQLVAVQERCRACGMAVGLYLDMAVSVDPDGSDVWANQAVYAAGLHIGAPPDEGNPAGQDWGLCPLRPAALQRSNYDLFRRTLAASMQFAGALRIDHVMGLMRLYLIPDGASPRDGAYLLYPFRELLDVVALESRRHGCMLIGEDLGTVDPAMQQAMREQRVLSYKVLYFEQSREEGFRRPETYPSLALATVSTHDLPTLAGWWSERDLDVRETLGLFPDPAVGVQQRKERKEHRRQLVAALAGAGHLPYDTAIDSLADAPLSEWLAHAVHVFVASGAAQVMMVQIEDVHGRREQANLPGTTTEHPNWRHKLTMDLDDDGLDPAAQQFAREVAAARDGRAVNPPP